LAGRPLQKRGFAATFRHLSHAKVDEDLTFTNQQIVKSTVNDFIVKQEFLATATNLIITTPRTSCIYFLPKIHKPKTCNCPTELISSYLYKILTPILRSLLSHVQDSQHALPIFRDFNFLGEDKPRSSSPQTLFDSRTAEEPRSKTLLQAELVLTRLNCSSFADNYYKQINGVANRVPKWDAATPIFS